MATNTPNLGLLKKNPATDGNETFNIETMLNNNWDKIDTVVGDMQDVPTASKDVSGAIKELFTNVVNGKNELVGAINDMEGSADPDDTFAQLAAAIRAIETGVDTEDATALASYILAGYTAYAEGQKLTGTMPFKKYGEGDGGSFDSFDCYEISVGYGEDGVHYIKMRPTPSLGRPIAYESDTWLRVEDNALFPENIKSGKNILGVIGKSTVVDTENANLNPAYLLQGQSGYDDGALKQGTMVRKTNTEPPAGTAQWGNGDLACYLNTGYYEAGAVELRVSVAQLQAAETDLKAPNIRSGINMFGVSGSLIEGKRKVTGQTVISSGTLPFTSLSSTGGDYYIEITGHGFIPGMVEAWDTFPPNNYRRMVVYFADGFYYSDVPIANFTVATGSNGSTNTGDYYFVTDSVSLTASLIRLPISGSNGYTLNYTVYEL
ncbi:MAG: hypothetical protein ACE3L7_29800 [Candidatus Pristimantibacillus sp.]